MSLIRELLELKKKSAPQQVTEGRHMWFEDAETVSIDPDRDDAHDLARALMPAIVKMAYVYLQEDKAKHDKMNSDEEDDSGNVPFDFSKSALIDMCDDIMDHMRKAMDNIDKEDWSSTIELVSHKFKEKLSK